MIEISAELIRPPRKKNTTESLLALGTFLAVAIAAYGIAFPLLLPSITNEFHQRYLACRWRLLLCM